MESVAAASADSGLSIWESLEGTPLDWYYMEPLVTMALLAQALVQVMHHCDFAWSTVDMCAENLVVRSLFDIGGNVWRHFFLAQLGLSDDAVFYLRCLNLYHFITHLIGMGMYLVNPEWLYYETRALQLGYVPKVYAFIEMCTETNDMSFYAWCCAQLAVRMHPALFMVTIMGTIAAYMQHVPALTRWEGFTFKECVRMCNGKIPPQVLIHHKPTAEEMREVEQMMAEIAAAKANNSNGTENASEPAADPNKAKNRNRNNSAGDARNKGGLTRRNSPPREVPTWEM